MVLIWLMFLAAAYPQQKGVVEGRVVNGTDPSIIARSIELDLVELGAGMNIVKTTTTDSAGRFRLEGLPESGRLMIRAIYRDVNYHSQFSMDASGRANVEIEVFEPTPSMEGIKIASAGIAFQIVGDQIQSLETITFNNSTKPPRTLMRPEGNYRFFKPAGIAEIPKIRVTAPGSRMPVIQAALESADGQSYYSLYPLKPGITTFEVQRLLPYADRKYLYAGKIYQDIASLNIGVNPADLTLAGQGLSKVSTDAAKNFAIYRSEFLKAGSEIAWTFSGGTAAPASTAETSEESSIKALPGIVGRKALVVGPLVLMGLVLVLWYALSRMQKGSSPAANSRVRELKIRRDQLLNEIADLDHRSEINALDRQAYLKQREENKRRLRRISLLLKM